MTARGDKLTATELARGTPLNRGLCRIAVTLRVSDFDALKSIAVAAGRSIDKQAARIITTQLRRRAALRAHEGGE